MRHFECGNPIIKEEDLNSEFFRDQILLFLAFYFHFESAHVLGDRMKYMLRYVIA